MGNNASAHGRTEAVDEAHAEATFTRYTAPVELHNCVRTRARGNPSFLRRTLKYRAPPRSATGRRESFELALSVTAPSSAQLSSARPAHTTVFVVMCDTSLEAGPVVKCAWRVKADAGDADDQRSVLSLPSALLAQKAGLEFFFFVWESRDDLYWVGGASGASVHTGMQADRIFGLVPEGSSVAWCRVPAEEFGRLADADAAARSARGKLALSNATLYRHAASPDGRLRLHFEEASARAQQPQRQLSYAVSGFRAVDTPPSPDPALAAERAFDAGGGPCRVWFHFLYDRNLRRRTEVTERSSCALCSLACCSFQGLQEHLQASHSQYAYTFSDPVSAVPTVNINCTPDTARLAAAKQPLDALAKEFRFQSRRYGIIAAPAPARPAAECAPTIGDSVLVPSLSKRKQYVGWADGDDSDDSGPAVGFKAPRAGGAGKRFGLSPEALPTKRIMTRPRQQFKTVKAAVHPTQAVSLAEHAAAGKFYHARTAMMLHPSELEEGYRDSDDDVDEQYWHTKCRRGIDEFGDVTRVEKDFMFMWNTYTYKRHIYADALLAEAVADFARLHRSRLCGDPELRRCFTLHLINLWDVCLIDGAAVDGALRLLEAGEVNA